MRQPSGSPWLESEVYHRLYFHVPRCLHTQQGPAITALHVFHSLEAVALLERNICLVSEQRSWYGPWNQWETGIRYTYQFTAHRMKSVRSSYGPWSNMWTYQPTNNTHIYIGSFWSPIPSRYPSIPETNVMESAWVQPWRLCLLRARPFGAVERCWRTLHSSCRDTEIICNIVTITIVMPTFLHSFLPLKDHERSQARNFPTFLYWFTSCSFAK